MVIGVDSHKETLAACAVDEIGRQLAAREFPNSRSGHLDHGISSRTYTQHPARFPRFGVAPRGR